MVLDLDKTLVHEDGRHEDVGILRALKEMGCELCLASRNDRYVAERVLRRLGVLSLFTYVMADFRPKQFQLRHILWAYGRRGVEFDRVLFVDDHRPNIEAVRQALPWVKCLRFGTDVLSLSALVDMLRDDA